jgi:hypothetical protein
MWHKVRGAKNWMTAMAVLFAVMATIVLLRELALWGPDFVAWDFVNDQITNEKFVLVMFGIAAVLFAFGIRRTEEFYR